MHPFLVPGFLLLRADFAVLDGKVQKDADQFIARAARCLGNLIDAIEDFDLQADGKDPVAVIAAQLFRNDQFFLHLESPLSVFYALSGKVDILINKLFDMLMNIKKK